MVRRRQGCFVCRLERGSGVPGSLGTVNQCRRAGDNQPGVARRAGNNQPGFARRAGNNQPGFVRRFRGDQYEGGCDHPCDNSGSGQPAASAGDDGAKQSPHLGKATNARQSQRPITCRDALLEPRATPHSPRLFSGLAQDRNSGPEVSQVSALAGSSVCKRCQGRSPSWQSGEPVRGSSGIHSRESTRRVCCTGFDALPRTFSTMLRDSGAHGDRGSDAEPTAVRAACHAGVQHALECPGTRG